MSVSESGIRNNFKSYPNPTNGQLSIDLGEQLPATEVTITNILGQEISKQQFKNTSLLNLEIEGESGVYFLSFKAGQNTAILKVLKL